MLSTPKGLAKGLLNKIAEAEGADRAAVCVVASMQLKHPFSLLCCLAMAAACAAQQPLHLPGSLMRTPPTIDGVVDENEEWKDVPNFGGLLDLVTGEKAPEDSRFWIAYDKEFIYFAAKLRDSQPNAIKATEYRTNVSVQGDDNVQFLVDLSGSLADFNEFHINPKGATNIQLAGGRAAKREWSGEFLAKGRITADGWECEAKIPWQVMRLPAAGRRNIRFMVARSLKRNQRSYVSAYSPNQGTQNAGFWEDVQIPKAIVDRSILLLPYGYLGHGQSEGTIVNSGVDVKTNLGEEIPLVVSANPDFRNIENSILSLDFSRFERLANETRPFFQEGGQYYNSALFASQRIPGFDAGMNVHGKLSDKLSFGVMDTIVFGSQDNLISNFSYDPTQNDSFRLTTTSLVKDGANNDAYLLRYSRILGPYGVFLRTMGTKDSAIGNGIFNTGGLGYNRGPFGAFVSYDLANDRFSPKLGFAPETDFKGLSYAAEFHKPVHWRSVSEAGFEFSGLNYDRFNGDSYRSQSNLAGSIAWKDGTQIHVSGDWETFLGSKDHIYQINVRRPRGNPYNFISLDYQFGEITQERYRSLTAGGALRPIKQLQLTGSVQVVDLGARSDQAIFGMNYDLGKDRSISGRMVKRGHDWNAYLALRQSGNKGAEYFLILGDPNSDRFQRSLILKVAMPLRIKG